VGRIGQFNGLDGLISQQQSSFSPTNTSYFADYCGALEEIAGYGKRFRVLPEQLANGRAEMAKNGWTYHVTSSVSRPARRSYSRGRDASMQRTIDPFVGFGHYLSVATSPTFSFAQGPRKLSRPFPLHNHSVIQSVLISISK
jgi:hypothetical protein